MKSADDYLVEAETLGSTEGCVAASRLLDEALAKYPNSKSLLILQSIHLGALKRYDEALNIYSRILELTRYDPYDEPMVLVNLGKMYIRMEKYAEALDVIEKAIVLNASKKSTCHIQRIGGHGMDDIVTLKPEEEPLTAEAYHTKGRALHGLGRYDEAIDAFDYVLVLEGILSETYYNVAHVYLSKGETLEDMGDKNAALDAYNKAIKVHDLIIKKEPNVADHYYDKGETLRELGRMDEAMEAFRKAKELDPDIYVPEIDGDLRPKE